MNARIVHQISYDAYCPDCQFAVEGFDDEDEAVEAVNAHNEENHA